MATPNSKHYPMDSNTLYFKNVSEEEKIREIQSLICNGFSPTDLTDERIFRPVYDSLLVWRAVMQLNSFKVSNVK